MGIVTGASMTLALLQSLCTAVLTVNSIRVGIGLAALAATSIAAPLVPLHKDSIRIPMLVIAVAGSVLNIVVLAWVRHLRNRPEAQWRRANCQGRNSDRSGCRWQWPFLRCS